MRLPCQAPAISWPRCTCMPARLRSHTAYQIIKPGCRLCSGHARLIILNLHTQRWPAKVEPFAHLSRKLRLRTGMPVTHASRHFTRLSLPLLAMTASAFPDTCTGDMYIGNVSNNCRT